MSVQFASAKYAIADCDRCGFQYKLKTLKEIYIRAKKTNILVCSTCWEPDQPQNFQGMYPVSDPQALRNPRPDTSYVQTAQSVGSRAIQWAWRPVGFNGDDALTPDNLKATGEVGTVTVTTS
jgi:hypothetical protein